VGRRLIGHLGVVPHYPHVGYVAAGPVGKKLGEKRNSLEGECDGKAISGAIFVVDYARFRPRRLGARGIRRRVLDFHGKIKYPAPGLRSASHRAGASMPSSSQIRALMRDPVFSFLGSVGVFDYNAFEHPPHQFRKMKTTKDPSAFRS